MSSRNRNWIFIPFLFQALYCKILEQVFSARKVAVQRGHKQRLAKPTRATKEIIFPVLMGQLINQVGLVDIDIILLSDSLECLYPYRVSPCCCHSLLFCKDSANEWNDKEKPRFSFHSRVQPILFKDSANRVKYKIKRVLFLFPR